jgi:signal peptidase I
MFNKSLRYSYTDQKIYAAKRRGIIAVVLLFFAVYLLITNFFFSMRILENTSMMPALNYGDRFIFSSFALKKLIPYLPFMEPLPVERGSIVLINRDALRHKNTVKLMLNKIIRFLSANKIGFPGIEEQMFIKRVIALPGDTISMSNFVLRVQPADEKYIFTEFELSSKLYEIIIPNVPALWDESIPFSGNMRKIVLGEDEFFVLSDDRSNTNDSRTWGPIPSDFISGKELFRYWPPVRIGIP